jgi:hypothetical protein
MLAYPAATPDDPALRLTVRDRRDGPRQTIPRDRWQFARDEQGKPAPDRGRVFMAAGFEPGRIYELVYTAQDPVLVGLAPQGFETSFRFEARRNRWGKFRHAFRRRSAAFFAGAWLWDFSKWPLPTDVSLLVLTRTRKGDAPSMGFWSMWPEPAVSFNHRFACFSRRAPLYELLLSDRYLPFTDLEQSDPETKLSEGILSRATKENVTPKVFYTNSSYEYYGRAASLIHTSLDGTQDAPLAKDTRIYLLAGGQHGPAAFPPSRQRTQQTPNPNNFRWSMRALLLALNRWVADGNEPPTSRYPRLADRNLTPLPNLKFPKLPGVRLPERIQTAYRLDFDRASVREGSFLLNHPKWASPFPRWVLSRPRRQRALLAFASLRSRYHWRHTRLELEGSGAWRCR